MEKEINEAMNKVALRYGGIYLDVDKHNQDVRLYKPFVSLVFTEGYCHIITACDWISYISQNDTAIKYHITAEKSNAITGQKKKPV